MAQIQKNNFINNIFFKKLNENIKGFLSIENILALRSDTSEVTVLQGMEFRPDKVASYYLGDERLGWLIDLTNGFFNGIRDYTLFRKIKIPNIAAVEELSKNKKLLEY